MNEQLMQWIVGAVVAAAIGAFLRFVPKDKLIVRTIPYSGFAGRFVSKFLILRIGKDAAEKVEEGIIVTLFSVLLANIECFLQNLRADNEKRKAQN